MLTAKLHELRKDDCLGRAKVRHFRSVTKLSPQTQVRGTSSLR